MKKIPFLRVFWAAALLEGLPAFIFLAAPVGRGWLRLSLLGFSGLAWLALAGMGGRYLFPAAKAGSFLERLCAWFKTGSRLQIFLAVLFASGVFSAEWILFTFMFLPSTLRGLAIWLFCLSLQSWVALRWGFRNEIRSNGGLLPSLESLDGQQKRILGILCLIGLVYFTAFIPANLKGTANAGEFLVSGGDEYVIYPILTTILTPAEDLRTTLYRLIEYDDYHYGYPFYLLSAAVLLPGRLVYGSAFIEQYRLNLFLLRQLISLLPVILSAFIFSYLGTRLKSPGRAVFLFILILSIPAVVRYGQQFWHPDGLAVLFVALTFFFLDRDHMRLGRNFYLAAVFCGLASAVRLVGFFFFLAVGLYLLAAWREKGHFGRVVLAGLLFAVTMAAAIILANPFLFDNGARGRMLATMGEKSVEMAQGYQEPDPEGVYRTGWAGWMPFFEHDYAQGWFIAYLGLSAGASAVLSRKIFPIVLTAWALAMGGYIVYFVAVKSFQYSLPLFIPLYSAGFLLPMWVEDHWRSSKGSPPGLWRGVVSWGAVLICTIQLVLNLARLAV